MSSLLEDLTKKVEIPEDININLSCPTPEFLTSLLGLPRGNFTDTCQPVTNRKLLMLMVTENVGPFAVTGLRPAVASLKRVMLDIKAEQPDIYSSLGTAGMLGCRYITSKRRSNTRRISSHSWGTAIDLTLSKVLDSRGDGKGLYGLTLIYPIFNRHGWYWGAGFRYEDAMHFELCRQKLIECRSAGELGTATRPVAAAMDLSLRSDASPLVSVLLQIGCNSPTVRTLQRKIRQHGLAVEVDGVFGPKTENAVKDLQRRYSLRPDGIVGPKTRLILSWR